MKKLLIASVLSLGLVSHASAAIEIDEKEDFGPTYGSTVADLTIGKPLQVIGATLGTALHIVGIPFSIASNSVSESYDTLVRQPWSALQRCNGCTPAYDSYIKSQENNTTGEVRFVVDKPSEIVIQTPTGVVVNGVVVNQ